MYSFESNVRYSEVDPDTVLTLTGLINYFQDCSTFQSESLGGGVKAMEEKGKFWVINSWQVEILRLPRLGEHIRIGTFPYEFKSFLGYRNFFLQDAEGNYLAKANSLWSLLDAATGKPCVATPDIMGIYTLEDKLDMEYSSRKISVPDTCAEQDAIKIARYHLDSNHHVNNGQYIGMAESYLKDSLGPGAQLKGLKVEYRRQTLEGETLHVFTGEEKSGNVEHRFVSFRADDGKANVNLELEITC